MYFKYGNLIELSEETVTSGGVKTLTATSATMQIFSGTSSHTLKMPNATTVKDGRKFDVINFSTGPISITNNSGAVIGTVDSNAYKTFTIIDIASSDGSVDISAGGVNASGKLALSKNSDSFTKQSGKIAFNPEEAGGDYYVSRNSDDCH
jgi:glutamine cyclotransferase